LSHTPDRWQIFRIEGRTDRVIVRTGTNGRVEVDVVVAGIGIEPNSILAKSSGLSVGSGIIVNEMLG
jgi:NAD(P)H-nitrite reductase large subunit